MHLLLIALLAAAPPEAAPSGPSASPAAAASPQDPLPDGPGRRTLGRLPVNIGRGFAGVFDRASALPFVTGASSAAVLSAVDTTVHENLADSESGFGKALETAGSWPSAVLVAGVYASSSFFPSRRFRALGYDLVAASVVNAGYTAALKLMVRRTRPDASNERSFPSGHTSNAFTLATVAERHYGWKVGVPAYAVAATVGYSRILRDKHFLSDVVAGATVGTVVGLTVVRMNDRPLSAARGRKLAWSMRPLAGPAGRGLEVTLAY